MSRVTSSAGEEPPTLLMRSKREGGSQTGTRAHDTGDESFGTRRLSHSHTLPRRLEGRQAGRHEGRRAPHATARDWTRGLSTTTLGRAKEARNERRRCLRILDAPVKRLILGAGGLPLLGGPRPPLPGRFSRLLPEASEFLPPPPPPPTSGHSTSFAPALRQPSSRYIDRLSSVCSVSSFSNIRDVRFSSRRSRFGWEKCPRRNLAGG